LFGPLSYFPPIKCTKFENPLFLHLSNAGFTGGGGVRETSVEENFEFLK
jgi:hypothetical protein